ncbi:MAG TPA: response regulator, partial [Clostridia bacterium]|nr:response regulator [Clostridia bacterium]
WPVLWVDAKGTILQANPEAQRRFGSALQPGTTHLDAIWSAQNPTPAVAFLSAWKAAPQPLTTLRFQAGNEVLTARVCLSAVVQGDQPGFLLQLLPEAEPAGSVDKQKLDCALQLARTVALDFNNALTSILGHASLLLSQCDSFNASRPSLLEIEKSALRAAEIASELGAFSHKEKTPPGNPAGNLNLLLERTVETFKQQSKPGAASPEWVLKLQPKLFQARFDEAKMGQVVIKVLENALEASRSRIVVLTRNIQDRPVQDRGLQLPSGTYICAEVTDDGAGIAPDVLPRVFEPFFTTKGAPHRGLGLAFVYGILSNHGGGVSISSHASLGTSVRIYLPAENKTVSPSNVQPGDLTGSGTILVVDDEPLLLTLAQMILSAYGYQVLTASSGQEATQLISRNPRLDLLITDLVMPGMSGRELIEHVQQFAPQVRILCSSGYVRSEGTLPDLAYLQKPFTSQELLASVKRVLSGDVRS